MFTKFDKKKVAYSFHQKTKKELHIHKQKVLYFKTCLGLINNERARREIFHT